MPSEPANLDQPKHPVYALTTYELSNYRGDLEHALKTLPSSAAVREQLQQRLTDVLTEEHDRAQLQQAGRS